MQVAHGWKGLSFNVAAVDLAGRQWWLEVCWQCFPNWPSAPKHCTPDMYFLEAFDAYMLMFRTWTLIRACQAYLKKVHTSNGISLILFWNKFQKGNDKVQKSVRIYNMCCEFIVLRSCAMLCLSWRWVEDKQSSEWWKPVYVKLKACFALRPSRRTSQTKSNAMRMRSTYSANSRSCCWCQDGTFQTSALTCRTLLLMDLQDGKWIKEDEEAPVNRGTSKPGTWCFVFSKLNDFYLLSLRLQPVILLTSPQIAES